MYYLISSEIIPDLLAALDRREVQKKRQDEEWVKRQKALGYLMVTKIEVLNVAAIKSLAEYEYEITAWSEEEAQAKMDALGWMKKPVVPFGTGPSWMFDSPICHGRQAHEPVEDYSDMPEVEQAEEFAATSASDPHEIPF